MRDLFFTFISGFSAEVFEIGRDLIDLQLQLNIDWHVFIKHTCITISLLV